MLTNSWLYHYYSVQSKIQFGLSYDPAHQQQPHSTSPRLNAHSPTLLQQQQQQQHPHHLHHHHHQFYPAATPIQPQALNHHHLPYGSSPHYSYGYQSPISTGHHPPTTAIHGSSSGSNGTGNGSSAGQQTHHSHNNNNNSHIIMNLNGGGGFETPPTKTTATTHVEDRPKTPQATTKRRAELSPSQQQHHQQQQQSQTVSSKKRAISRLEPIYIPDQSSSPEDALVELRNGFSGENSNQTVIMGTISYAARPRTKFVGKLQATPLIDSTEFIEQWNPSPPWSEAAQKVPDIGPQELSPYMTTTTPPTPNSANIITPTATNASHIGGLAGVLSGPKSAVNGSLSGHGSAFSFDWVPEQFVPVASADCSLALPPPVPPINCVSYMHQDLSSHQHRSFWSPSTSASAATTTMVAMPLNHHHNHLTVRHHHSSSLGYEEAHLQQQQQRGNLLITEESSRGLNKSSSSGINNNGKDSSDEDRVSRNGHSKGQQ